MAGERGLATHPYSRINGPIQGLNLLTQAPPEFADIKRKADLKRLLKNMQASNTEAMVPLKREEIYDR